MKVLLFGSNGLVGSNVKKKLENKKYDSLFSTRETNDLFNLELTKRNIKEFNPDVIINCAAKVGGILANDTYRTAFLLENLKINMNILESIIDLDSIKVINLGSSCIYPLDAENPIKEDSFMTGKLEETNSPYAMAKLTAIELGMSLTREYGHQIVNLMPTNLYGEYDSFSEKNSHVIPGLIYRMHSSKINQKEAFKVWGSGEPLREFLYAGDLANAIIFILENNINDQLINIGSGSEISIKNLAYKLKEIIAFKGEIEFDLSMPDGNPRKLLDSTKIFNYGWKPEVDLDSGLKLSYEWFLKNLD
jgi:GDP-L-fucose synthase